MKIGAKPTELPAWDYTIRSFDGWTLEIEAGSDSSIHTSPVFLLRFTGVSYIDCPAELSHASIRTASLEEWKEVAKRNAISDGQSVYALEAETMGDLGIQTFFIVAERVERRETKCAQATEGESPS